LSLPDLYCEKKRRAEKIAALTCYDYPLARLVDECGIDLLLVGDSLGMVVLGYPDTTSVTMSDMVHHTRAAARGVTHATLVSDLPAGSYSQPEAALSNAQLLIAAGAAAVKLEGGQRVTPQVALLTASGIPVLAHIGMLPQHVHEEGGYRVKGRTDEQAEQLRTDAIAVQQAGAFAVVLELVAPALASQLSSLLAIPTIGIGSGEGCDGQILVTHDLIGLFPWFRPKFVRPKAEVGSAIQAAVKSYVQEVHGRQSDRVDESVDPH
jgi:3-methyl-2-oxobutanoate hydroxymethyltransferase